MAEIDNNSAQQLNLEQQKCRELILAGRNLLVLGQAGCGKTLFIEKITGELRTGGKNVQITSMTAISAIPIGGITLHKFLGMMEGAVSIRQLMGRGKHLKAKIPKIDVLVVDEVSMMSGEMVHVMDEMMKFACENKLPFGGKQILLFGDLKQLPPVKGDRFINFDGDMGEKINYKETYFISTDAFRNGNFHYVEFHKVYRQQDPSFLSLLNNLRQNDLTSSNVNTLKSRDIKNFPAVDRNDMLQLFPINKCVITKNKEKLDAIPGEIIKIPAKGAENKKNAKELTELKKLGLDIIETKIGAEMMIRKNLDIGSKLVNGRIGKLHSITKNSSGEISTLNLEIENIIHPIPRYTYSKPEVDEKGKQKISTQPLEQFPLTLAYAFTFHKSQGMTISTPTYINFMNCREPHSHYVAIGRVTDLNNLYLENFDPKKISIHPEVSKIFSEREKYFVE